jgi:hypothetical protein
MVQHFRVTKTGYRFDRHALTREEVQRKLKKPKKDVALQELDTTRAVIKNYCREHRLTGGNAAAWARDFLRRNKLDEKLAPDIIKEDEEPEKEVPDDSDFILVEK